MVVALESNSVLVSEFFFFNLYSDANDLDSDLNHEDSDSDSSP